MYIFYLLLLWTFPSIECVYLLPAKKCIYSTDNGISQIDTRTHRRNTTHTKPNFHCELNFDNKQLGNNKVVMVIFKIVIVSCYTRENEI